LSRVGEGNVEEDGAGFDHFILHFLAEPFQENIQFADSGPIIGQLPAPPPPVLLSQQPEDDDDDDDDSD